LVVDSDKNESETVAKLEGEMEVVKEIDAAMLNLLAEVHVLRTIGKKKLVVRSRLWPVALVYKREVVERELTAVAKNKMEKGWGNVVARLFGSCPVREAVRPVVEEVVRIMGLSGRDVREIENAGKVHQQSSLRQVAEENISEDQKGENDREVEMTNGGPVLEESEEFGGLSSDLRDSASENESSSEAEEPSEDDVDPWQRVMDPNATDFAEFEERIGVSDDDQDSAESFLGPKQNELDRTDDEWSGSEADDEKDDEEEEEEEDGDIDLDIDDEIVESSTTLSPQPPSKIFSAHPKPIQSKLLKDNSRLKQSSKSTMSQFLPTLLSGYVSGGDSDPDADYYKNRGKKGRQEKPERKNRMGQQARRALWEKKYGRGANHVQKEEQKKREKQHARTERAGTRGSRCGNGPSRTGDGNDRIGRPPFKKDEGPLHPSWEAARKAKEKQAQMAAAMFKPQGKRITFD
jgi:hypothetical protein